MDPRFVALRTTLSTLTKGEPRYFASPGRTELGGNHTDHNHGRVLAGAITLDSIAAASPRNDHMVVIHAEGYPPMELSLKDLGSRPQEAETSTALVRGVAAWLTTKGYTIGGFDAAISSTVLRGSGLSSSASFEVLVGTIFNHLYNQGSITPVSLAQAGQFAENQYFGKPSGLMDQVACAHGGVVAIDFEDPSNPRVESVALDLKSRGYALMIVSTGDDHADLTAEYAAIPGEMKAVAKHFSRPVLRGLSHQDLDSQLATLRKTLGDRAILRARHFIDENQRPPLMVEALRRGDFASYLELVKASGLSSARRLQNLHAPSSTVSQCMDLALDLAETYLGNSGAVRVHGGGFGGTIQAYVPLQDCLGFTTLMEHTFGPGSVRQLDISPLGCREVLL